MSGERIHVDVGMSSRTPICRVRTFGQAYRVRVATLEL
jgi:hypothetical protein